LKTTLVDSMRTISFVFFLFLTSIIASSQTIEMECTISRKSGAELVLNPAYFDLNSLPIVGSSVLLNIYVKGNTGSDYHEITQLTVMKWFPESKSILLLLPKDFEKDLQNYGLNKSDISTGEKVKISWNH
jgi:hypothetical protein